MTIEKLCQHAFEHASRVETPYFDPETRRIWVLIGALSEAFFARVNEPGFSILDRIGTEQFIPETADELMIWDELTAPHNYAAVLRYVDFCGSDVNRFAKQLHATILTAARRRLEKT